MVLHTILAILIHIIALVSSAGLKLESLVISGNEPVETGETAEIYCDYKASHAVIISTQWYKFVGDEKIHVYSFVRGDHDFAKDQLVGRAQLYQKYGRFTLQIHDMQLSDEGTYQCQLFQSYSNQLTSPKYPLRVSIPAKVPTIDSTHHPNGTGLTVHCSGNVGRPGGSLTLYQRQNQNWTELESFEIQRIYANQTITTFVKSSIRAIDSKEPLHVKCSAKNDARSEKVFSTEKFIDIPKVAGNRDPTGASSDSSSSSSSKSFHIAGYTTIVLLIVSGLLFALYMLNKHTNLSLKRCIKRKRRRDSHGAGGTLT